MFSSWLSRHLCVREPSDVEARARTSRIIHVAVLSQEPTVYCAFPKGTDEQISQNRERMMSRTQSLLPSNS